MKKPEFPKPKFKIGDIVVVLIDYSYFSKELGSLYTQAVIKDGIYENNSWNYDLACLSGIIGTMKSVKENNIFSL